MEGFFAFLITFIFILFKLAATGRLDQIRDSINRPLNKSIFRYFDFTKINPTYKKILEDQCVYYQKLNAKNKILFEKRVQTFIEAKNFVPCGEMNKVTAEMKTLIAACGVQVTFGLPNINLDHFERVYIYAKAYFSDATQQYSEGEVHIKHGVIILSWKDFLDGYNNQIDAKNVGIRQMALALRLANRIENEEYGLLNWEDLQIVNDITIAESNKIKTGQSTIFSHDASVHYHDFFAELVEIFFEQPKTLWKYHPPLYQVTCRLLNQNPMDTNEPIEA